MFIFDAPGNNIYELNYCSTKVQGVITLAIFSKIQSIFPTRGTEVPPT